MMIDTSLPCWYKATTFSERLAALSDADKARFSQQQYDEKIDKKLNRWREQPPFQRENYFEQRLASDQLTEQIFKGLLAETPAAVQARLGSVPTWLTQFAEIYNAPVIVGAIPTEFQAQIDQSAMVLFKPLIAHYCQRLAFDLADMGEDAPFDSAEIHPRLVAHLLPLISNLFKQVISLEYQVASITGLLEGEARDERFQSFVHLLTTDHALSLMQEYPVLVRTVLETTQRWHANSTRFLRRLCADWSEIKSIFQFTDDKLEAVTGDMGDSHTGGQAVLILRFKSGRKLVYKPKSLGTAEHFQTLLRWFNAQGFEPALRPLAILARDGYGWLEFVAPEPCESEAAIGRFYERQGAYLAIAHAIRGSDFHYENVIATGEHPILIDLETLFNPEVDSLAAEDAEFEGSAIFRQSLISTLLLPTANNKKGRDIGAMGAIAHYPDSPNRPTLNGEPINVLDHTDSVLAGFTRMYRLIGARRAALRDEVYTLFLQDPVRIILRDTSIYGLLLRQLLQPSEMRDGMIRARTLDRLWGSVVENPYLHDAIPSERLDLSQHDVPYFYTLPKSHDVWCSDGAKVSSVISHSGWELMLRRLAEWDSADFEQQTWFIRGAFATIPQGIDHAYMPQCALGAEGQPFSRPALVTLASQIADRVTANAIQHDETIAWADFHRRNRRWFMHPIDVNLFSGLPGTALFYAYLGATSQDETYTQLARKVLHSLEHTLHRPNPYAESRPLYNMIGLMEGLGGYLYSMAQLGALWKDDGLLDLAETYSHDVERLLERDTIYDVWSGAAGAILGLLALWRIRPNVETLRLADVCAAHIRDNATQTDAGIVWESDKRRNRANTGMGTGGAGIAFALAQLALVTGDGQDAALIETLLQQEETAESADLSWASGLVGRTLAHIHTQRDPQDARTILQASQGGNDSLDSGTLGQLDLLSQIADMTDDHALQAYVQTQVMRVVATISQHGATCGTPFGFAANGLMIGLCGIGYGLLRLAYPDVVPSILSAGTPLLQPTTA